VPGLEVKDMKKLAIIAIAMLVSVALLAGMTNAGQTAAITTDKDQYEQGETVHITITNTCRSTIILEGFWIEDEGCETVYSASTVQFPIQLLPGETFRAEWDQVTDTGETAVPGTYTIMTENDYVKIVILSPPQPSIEVSTDSQTYTVGEDVQIIMTNVGTENVICPGYWIEDANGVVIYTPNTVLYMRPIAPGESITFIWNQMDDAGNQVATGTYLVCTLQDRIGINIFEGPNVEVLADKPVYEMGEKIRITITNTGDLPTTVTNGFCVADKDGNVIYTPNMLAFMIPLNPGASIVYTWDQTDDGGSQVVPGAYTVITQQGSVTIHIIGPVLAGHGAAQGGSSVDGPGHFIPKPVGHTFRI
jgi:hypothetical protein